MVTYMVSNVEGGTTGHIIETKKTVFVCISCKTEFDKYDDFTEHLRSITHLIEQMRWNINRQIDGFEFEMRKAWIREKDASNSR